MPRLIIRTTKFEQSSMSFYYYYYSIDWGLLTTINDVRRYDYYTYRKLFTIILLRAPRQQVFLVAKSYGNVMKSLKCSGRISQNWRFYMKKVSFFLLKRHYCTLTMFSKRVWKIMMSPKNSTAHIDIQENILEIVN